MILLFGLFLVLSANWFIEYTLYHIFIIISLTASTAPVVDIEPSGDDSEEVVG